MAINHQSSIINRQSYEVLGLMSGTSLDGVDLAYCVFENNDAWDYKILHAATIPYDNEWKIRLQGAADISGEELALLDADYGHFLGNITNDFLKEINKKPNFIASHGHTIFHQPHRRFTLQIGDGAAIAAVTKTTVVNQFRNTDVALGGQGAPLVPIGDKLLFGHFDICLNLGGIANLSYEKDVKRIAYDISVCNMALNKIIAVLDKNYDEDGVLAREGKVNPELFNQLNALDYYKQGAPKSLGYEWFQQNFLPLLDASECSLSDKLHTVCEHIALQIANAVNPMNKRNMLITGGGAHNKFLVDCIRSKVNFDVIIPDKLSIDYKEALVFAFLGVLRMCNINNALSSVTGAIQDNSGGAVYFF